MIDILLLLILVVCAVTAVVLKDLLSVTIVLGAYSLIMAIVWMRLNAVDVAFTEAAVGAGITGILSIAALARTTRMEREDRPGPRFTFKKAVMFIVVLCTAGVLVYGTFDLPGFGDPTAPAQTHVAPRYIDGAYNEMAIPNMVTAVLANYRGYDTLGETTVVFTAGLIIIFLLRKK
ncbi:MAG: DUF4040 domain-containing protein [Thermodesulfobacteriota bacterium]|nr:MAG: DUF4040 domain-containing protein [Thermodesulfobacteriota bacterium]